MSDIVSTSALPVGRVAPAFTLPATPDQTVSLDDLRGKPVILASVYNTLERLEQKGLVRSTIGQPTAERGGRAKRYFSTTTDGLREVRAAKKALTVLWRGIPVHEG